MCLYQDTHLLSHVKSTARYFLETGYLRDYFVATSFGNSEYDDESMAQVNAITQDWDVVIGDNISTNEEWTSFLHDGSRRRTRQTSDGAVKVKVRFG